jgi:hypothetical protein
MKATSLCKTVFQFVIDMNKEGPQSNSEDQQMFSVSDTEPVCIKQEEDLCTEILPDLDGAVSGHLHLYIQNFLHSFVLLLLGIQMK